MEQAFHNGYKDAVTFLWNKGGSNEELKILNNGHAFSVVKFCFMSSCLDLVSSPKTQGFQSCDSTYAQMLLEITKMEEEEIKMEQQATTLTSFTDYRSKLIVNSTEPENTKDPLLVFDDVKNGMAYHTNNTCYKKSLLLLIYVETKWGVLQSGIKSMPVETKYALFYNVCLIYSLIHPCKNVNFRFKF